MEILDKSDEWSGDIASSPVLLQTIIDLIPGTLHVKDAQLRYCLVNRYFLERWGFTRDWVIGKTSSEVFHDEYDSVIEERDRRVLETGEALPFYEATYPNPRGGWLTLWATKVPLKDESGKVRFIVTIGVDITDRKIAETLVRESEQLKSALIDTALDCIVTIDEDGRVLDFNPAAEATFGHSRAEALGQPIAELIIPPHLRARHEAGFARYLAGGKSRMLSRRIELEGMRADGSLFPVEISIGEVSLADRRVFTAFLRDLTEQKRVAAEMEQQRERLHQSEKLAALGSLLGGIAHELNNPLSIIVARAAMLEDKRLANISTESIGQIRQAAERCAKIVRTFLDMARQSRPQREPADANALVERALELAGGDLASHAIEVETDLAASLPPVMVDEDQILQVLSNLILNAQHALQQQADNRRIRLATRLRKKAGILRIEVEDSGPGIPPEIRSRIFDPFFTTKAAGVGTGLGLAVSLGMVEAHGGRLVLKTREGRGTTFAIELPLDEGDELRQEASAPKPVKRGQRVLIAEGSDEVAELLDDCLSMAGFDTEIVPDESAALGRAAELPFDAVLCGFAQPGRRGRRFFESLREVAPDQAERVIFIVENGLGHHDPDLKQTGRPILEKPFTPELLRNLVSAVAWDEGQTFSQD